MCATLRGVTHHTAEYFQHWVGATQLCDRERIHAAQALLAAGCGPARGPTCEAVLRLMECDVWAFGDGAFGMRVALQGQMLLTRALTLFGPGELLVLQSKCRGFTDSVMALLGLQAAPPRGAEAREPPGPDRLPEGDRPAVSTVRPDILSGLRSLSLADWGGRRADEFALLGLCGASLTELHIKRCGHTPAAAWRRVVSRCPRLESLTGEFSFFPLSLLHGLAQLHTLHGVDFAKVPVSAIAAALPRLHTLTAYMVSSDPIPIACTAGFCEDLLPRLRVFGFEGVWLWDQVHASADGDGAAQRALPLLRELSWAPWQTTPKAFLGGQPLRLQVSRKMVASWIDEAERASSVATADATAFHGPLARVQQLRITSPKYSTSVHRSNGAVDMARLLRAAPQLRAISTHEWPDDDMYWCKLTAPADPAFAGLVHPRLRSIEVRDRGYVSRRSGAAVAPDVAQQLRRGHFPRLRSLKLKGVEYFGNPVD
jgi:hypothetical protein